MSNHTGTVCVCQTHAHPPRPESTPPALDTIDRRLVQRYGAWLLTGGYTALPTYAWIYYARLGVSEAEMVCLAQLCTYWWSARDPFPGEAALAARMGKTVRTIQGYLRSLEAKGLLHIQTRLSTNGRQSTNAYDLRPFFAAVEGLARLDGLLPADAAPMTPATPDNDSCNDCKGQIDVAQAGPQFTHDGGAGRLGVVPVQTSASCSLPPHSVCNVLLPNTDSCNDGPCDDNNRAQGDAEQEPLCAGATSVGTENRPKDARTPTTGEGEGSRAGGMKDSSPQVNPIEIETFDYDSIPPTPAKATLTTASSDDQPHTDDDGDDRALSAVLAVLSTELGDDAPRSSLGRARNLRRDAGVSLDRFLCLLDEAAARTRDRQAGIVKRRRDGQTPNGMPYLFAVLQDLVHPAPPRTRDGGSAANRPRVGPSGRRRRRREGGRGEAVNSYAAWADSPARLPIVEEHPVWRAVLDDLAQVLTVENFNAWLASTRALDQDGELLRVVVPATFNKTWLEQKLAGKVLSALERLDYGRLDDAVTRVRRVEYSVEEVA